MYSRGLPDGAGVCRDPWSLRERIRGVHLLTEQIATTLIGPGISHTLAAIAEYGSGWRTILSAVTLLSHGFGRLKVQQIGQLGPEADHEPDRLLPVARTEGHRRLQSRRVPAQPHQPVEGDAGLHRRALHRLGPAAAGAALAGAALDRVHRHPAGLRAQLLDPAADAEAGLRPGADADRGQAAVAGDGLADRPRRHPGAAAAALAHLRAADSGVGGVDGAVRPGRHAQRVKRVSYGHPQPAQRDRRGVDGADAGVYRHSPGRAAGRPAARHADRKSTRL